MMIATFWSIVAIIFFIGVKVLCSFLSQLFDLHLNLLLILSLFSSNVSLIIFLPRSFLEVQLLCQGQALFRLIMLCPIISLLLGHHLYAVPINLLQILQAYHINMNLLIYAIPIHIHQCFLLVVVFASLTCIVHLVRFIHPLSNISTISFTSTSLLLDLYMSHIALILLLLWCWGI